MIKKLSKIILFVLTIAFHLSLPSLAMNDIYELDFIVGNKKLKLKDLREISEDCFQKPHIKLRNIPSVKSFFDKSGRYNDTQSVSHKLLKAIVNGYADIIDYSYSPDRKEKHRDIDDFMDCIALGEDVATVQEDGTNKFALRNDYRILEAGSTPFNSRRIYNEFIKINRRIVVIVNGELHWATQKWQEEEQLNKRLRQLSLMEAEERRREQAEEDLETMGGGAYGYAQGYDPFFNE